VKKFGWQQEEFLLRSKSNETEANKSADGMQI
jgi:hypothetical protein